MLYIYLVQFPTYDFQSVVIPMKFQDTAITAIPKTALSQHHFLKDVHPNWITIVLFILNVLCIEFDAIPFDICQDRASWTSWKECLSQ